MAASMVTRAGLFISGIAVQSVLAYALLPDGRGAYAVCILFANLLGILFTPGAGAGAQYLVISKEISVSQGVSVSIAICLLGAALAAGAANPLIHSDIPFFRRAELGSFRLALILVPLSTFSSAMHHQLAGLGRFRNLAMYTFIQTAVNGLVISTLVLFYQLGVNGAIVSVGIGNLVMICLCLRDLRRSTSMGWEPPSLFALTRVLRYGLKYHAARIGGSIDARVGVLIVGMIADRSEVGLFAVVSATMMHFVMISQSVAAPLISRVARDGHSRPKLVSFCARITIWITGAMLIVLIAFSVPVVRLLLSERFLPIVPLIPIVAPGILAFAGANVLTSYFRGANRPEVCSWAAVAGLSVNLLVTPWLYPALGLAAAAWGMAAALFARSLLLSVAYSRATQTRLIALWAPQPGDVARIRRSATATLRRVIRRSSVRNHVE